jgi:hypothetical protein
MKTVQVTNGSVICFRSRRSRGSHLSNYFYRWVRYRYVYFHLGCCSTFLLMTIAFGVEANKAGKLLSEIFAAAPAS